MKAWLCGAAALGCAASVRATVEGRTVEVPGAKGAQRLGGGPFLYNVRLGADNGKDGCG